LPETCELSSPEPHDIPSLKKHVPAIAGTGILMALLIGITLLSERGQTELPTSGSGWQVEPVAEAGSTAAPTPGSGEQVAEASAEIAEGSAEPQLYTVEAGDSFWLIGNQFGIPYQRIMEANGITTETLQPGQVLIIPPPEAPRERVVASGNIHLIEPGDFLETIAAETGCTVSELMVANNLVDDSIYAGDTLQIPVCTGSAGEGSGGVSPAAEVPEGTYVIQPGDTIGGIALRNGCSVGEVMTANSMSSDFIRAGDPILIPENCTGTPVEVRNSSVQRAPAVRSGGDLASLMREHGFRAPSQFKAYVLSITFDANRQIVSQQSYDYNNTGDDFTNWNAASTIKLYSAIAALQKAEGMGFSHNATVTFHGRGGNHTFTLRELIADALGPSDNIAHNFLVTFTGHDDLNTRFFSSRNGFSHSAIRRAYETSRWMSMGEAASLRNSPRITITEGGRSEEIAARTGTASPNCDGAACTSLDDLAECMRRLMLQEQLPERETFRLSPEGLRFIRQTLATDRSRGMEVVEGLAAGLNRDDVVFFHKAGFAGDWYSDNVYVYVRGSSQAWVVSMAGYPGRSSLNSAARAIGEILAAGEL
jgi:LysM repeat protein